MIEKYELSKKTAKKLLKAGLKEDELIKNSNLAERRAEAWFPNKTIGMVKTKKSNGSYLTCPFCKKPAVKIIYFDNLNKDACIFHSYDLYKGVCIKENNVWRQNFTIREEQVWDKENNVWRLNITLE